MDKKQMQARLRELLGKVDGILAKAKGENRQLSADEQAEVDGHNKEMDELQTKLEAITRDEETRRKHEERRARLRPQQRPLEDGSDPEPLTEDRSDYNRWPVEEAGQFLRAAYRHQFGMELQGDLHEELRDTFRAAVETRAPSGQNTIVLDEGALLVPETIQSAILQKVHQEGQVLSRCQQITISVGRSTTWNGVREDSRVSGQRYGGIVVSRKGESIAAEISKAKFEQVKLELKKQTCAVAFTEEQREDGAQANTIVTSLVPSAFTFATEREIIEGAGAAEIEGLLNSPALITQTKETGQPAATIVFENIQNMWNKMPPANRGNAVWFINLDVEPQLQKMYLAIGTAGVPVYLPANGLSQSGFATLMGRPVIPIEHCSALGTKGDIILADMSQFVYASKGTLRSAVSMHVKFLEGEDIVRFIMRDDGKTLWRKTMAPAKGSTSRTPFITLETRS